MVAEGGEPERGDTLDVLVLGVVAAFRDFGNLGTFLFLVVGFNVGIGRLAGFDFGVGGLDGAGDDLGTAGVEGGELGGELGVNPCFILTRSTVTCKEEPAATSTTMFMLVSLAR